MTTIRTGLLTTMLIALATAAWAQGNPCSDPLPAGVKVNPTKLIAQLPDQTVTLADGTPGVTEYQIGYFTPTGTAPVQTITIPKTAWTLVAGTPDCYQTTQQTFPVAMDTVFVSKLNARRVPGTGGLAAEESGWSTPSNPFARTAAPRVPPVLVAR
jgi:hypothetical protein